MLKKLLERINGALAPGSDAGTEPERQGALRLATAVLMADVARADSSFSELEFERVLTLAVHHFGLDADAAAELVNQADERAEALVSLHELTQLLHAKLSDDEKVDVVRLLWGVAYADGCLDPAEDALVLKIGDLLHVSRAAVMRLKYDAAIAHGH